MPHASWTGGYCSSLRGISSGVLSPYSLVERSLCLIAVFSSPFPSVFTGRGGYNLGGPAEVEFWGRWPEVSIAGIGACQNGGSTNSGRVGRRAAAAAGTSPGPGSALRRPPVLVEPWEAGASLSSMGEGSGHPRPNPAEFPFLSSVDFCVINIFPFPFWIQLSWLSCDSCMDCFHYF